MEKRGSLRRIIRQNFSSFSQDYAKVLKSQILKPCGIKPVKVTQVTRVEYMSDRQRKEELEKIAQIAKGFKSALQVMTEHAEDE